jgi:prephenate dehydrogenase
MVVGVYGLGRFGSLWARTLATRWEVCAYSRNAERITPKGVKRVAEDVLLECPTIFLCVAISALEEVVERIAARLAPGTLVADTCSVKVHPARVMEKFFPSGVSILATHPMFGPDSARFGLNGLPMILCPVRVEESVTRWWTRQLEEMGLKVETMSPEEHDREAAFTQGITHYIGRVLADLSLGESRIGTLGYRKLLEIMEQTCNDPWQLFLDLQRYNPYTRAMRSQLHKSLEKIMRVLEGTAGDSATS